MGPEEPEQRVLEAQRAGTVVEAPHSCVSQVEGCKELMSTAPCTPTVARV